MELRFRISAEQCQALADRITANRIARIESRQAAARARIEAFMLRWLPRAFLVFPLALAGWGPLTAPSHRGITGFVVAALIYFVFWWRFGAALSRFVVHHSLRLRVKRDRFTAPFVGGITKRSVQRSVARLEGLHRWMLTPAALSVQGPSGKTAVIPW